MKTNKAIDKVAKDYGGALKALGDPTKNHTHCWQEKNPPCGQKIEHLKCCLCEKLNPKLLEAVREAERERMALMMAKMFGRELDWKMNPEQMQEALLMFLRPRKAPTNKTE